MTTKRLRRFLPPCFMLIVALGSGCGRFGAGGGHIHSPGSTQTAESTSVLEGEGTAAVQDDLMWLVGRWKCIVRRYVPPWDAPLGAEDELEYFNLYFPYADDRLTLDLTADPEDRPVAAEFLVRQVINLPLSFEDRLVHLLPWGPVRIGKHRIRVGYPPFEDYEFRYEVRKKSGVTWLVLESRFVHLELIKVRDEPGDITKSLVMAPIKSYPQERIFELKQRYEELRKSRSAE